MPGYRAVIFDFGGVITTSPTLVMRSFCEQHSLPWAEVSPLLAAREGAWSRFETSALSRDEFVRAFELECEGLGHSIDGAAFLSHFFGGMTLRQDMVAVVRDLRRRLRVGCITNNVQTGSRQRLIQFEELFDVVVESSIEGVRKPDPAIYLIACDRLGVKPEEAIFLDDFGVNLKAARALGMATIKVDETQSAIGELEQLLGFELPRGGAGNVVAAG